MTARKVVRQRNVRTPAAREPEFPLDIWLSNSKKMIGQARHIIVGATYGRPAHEVYSKTKMRDLIKRFLSMR